MQAGEIFAQECAAWYVFSFIFPPPCVFYTFYLKMNIPVDVLETHKNLQYKRLLQKRKQKNWGFWGAW